MVEHLFFTIIFIISLNFSLGALRFSKINRTFLSMYRGIFEASVVTINDLGEPIYPYFDENVLNHYVDTNIGCSAYVLMANKDAWNLMDADLQTAIKSVSGDYLLNLVSIWDYWEAAGRYAALEKGGDIFTPSTELKSELDANYAIVAENWINSEDDTTAAQAIYDQADELVKKYNAEFDW